MEEDRSLVQSEMSIADDFLIQVAEHAEKRIDAVIKIKKIALRHAALLYRGKKSLGMLEIRKHLVWYFKGFPGAAELRKKLVQVKSVSEIKGILKQP